MVKSRTYVAEPLRLGQSVGAALAFCGVSRCTPLLLGAQGCAAVAGALLTRHFRRPLPLRSVAMNEISAALGGKEEIAKALAAIERDDAPSLIGVITSGVNEARGDDLTGLLGQIQKSRCNAEAGAAEWLAVSTPDFAGSLQDGWSRAVGRMVEVFAHPCADTDPLQVALLPGSHLTPADVEELKALVMAFGLHSVTLPDLSGVLERRCTSFSFGTVSLDQIREIGRSAFAIGFGEQMRTPCELLKAACGTPYSLLDAPFGLAGTDRLMALLSEISGRKAPVSLRRERDMLIDVMADSAGLVSGRPAALAGEVDQVSSLARFFVELGMEVAVAVVAARSPVLERIPALRIQIGDFDDLEREALHCDLIAAPSGAHRAAERLRIPLSRCGLPIIDRLDAPFRVQLGYRGARELVFRLASALSGLGRNPSRRCHDTLKYEFP